MKRNFQLNKGNNNIKTIAQTHDPLIFGSDNKTST